jgi:hypothetical protein
MALIHETNDAEFEFEFAVAFSIAQAPHKMTSLWPARNLSSRLSTTPRPDTSGADGRALMAMGFLAVAGVAGLF